MSENPVPTIIVKPRKPDEYYKDHLEENRAKIEFALDGTLEKIQPFAASTKKFDYQRHSGGSQGYKNRIFPGKKMQQKDNFFQQEHLSAKKTQ